MAIWISPGHDFRGRHGLGRLEHGLAAMDSVQCHAGKGIVDDRYYGHKEDYKGQITFFDEAVASELERNFNLAELDRSLFRRNVLLSGIELNSLIGKRFRLGELILTGSEECSPCYWMDEAVTPGAHEWLKGRGGLRCRIVESGLLKLGSHELEVLS
ncbi:MOSC domain-containing protein [Cerasicoccus maritimus]|uniref:MOSC domain-containing protein n=1 Tax=Cerasicoccus maritimus TaxID=490089 RepID=UPI002852C30D|nr:MOSC domain-containing protein [Cerasicoccus maritimus]